MGDAPHPSAKDRSGIRQLMLIYKGPLALLAGAVMFAVMAISVKYAAAALPAGEIVMFRFLMGLAVLQALSGGGLIRVNHQRRSMLIARGLTGALSISFYFASIKNTTLMKATLLSNAYPITTAVFGWLLLRERLSGPTLAAFAVALAGMWLVVDPQVGALVAGDLYGVASAVCAGLAIVTVRELRRTESAYTVFWYLCVFGALMGALSCAGTFRWPTSREWVWLLISGISSTAGQLVTTYGLKYAPAAEGALIAMSTVAYSGAFGWLFLGERMAAQGLAGALMVLAGAGFVAARQSDQEPGGSLGGDTPPPITETSEARQEL